MKSMIIDKVPRRFAEGPFWGNGKMGTVLYIKEQALYFSIDHVTLWELRETLPDRPKATFQEIRTHKKEFLAGDPSYVEDTNIFDTQIGRTRLPALGVSMKLPFDVRTFRSETDFEMASTKIKMELEDGSLLKAEIWLDSLENVLNVHLSGKRAAEIVPEARGWDYCLESLKPLKNWNYPPCEESRSFGRFFMEQKYGGDRTAVLVGERENGRDSLDFTVTIATGKEEEGGQLKEQLGSFLDRYLAGKEAYREAHEKDWKAFWSESSIEVPNERIQEAYEQELYKIYCNERPDSMPVTLQGVWNPNDRMPAWFGDLHNDLNVECCYWAAFKSGHAELARPYIEYYSRALPRFQERAKKLFGLDGAVHIPTMMAPDGTGAASEWCFWNVLLGPELFVATDFCWFYEYTKDRKTLKEKILPLLKGVVRLYEGIAEEGEDGKLHIPFTCSPEVFGKEGMILREDATITLSVLHYVLDHLKTYSVICGEQEKVKEWEEFDRRLARVKTDETGYPLFDGLDVFESHRHFCQLFPVFPLGTDTHSETAERSLDTAVNMGFLEYAAFSFPYMGIFASRCGRGNMARTMLELYCMGFRSGNSFTVNGDPYQNGLLRISDTNAGESSDAFTLESGFFVPAVVCDMFTHRSQDTIWLLYGIPDEWKACSARGLAVEGGHRVSVEQEDYHIRKAVIKAGCAETLMIRWKGGEVLKKVSRNGEEYLGSRKDFLKVSVSEGDQLELCW